MSAVFVIGILAFAVLTQEPSILGHQSAFNTPTTDGEIGLAPASGDMDQHGRVHPTADHGLGGRNMVRPASMIVRGAFQGAY